MPTPLPRRTLLKAAGAGLAGLCAGCRTWPSPEAPPMSATSATPSLAASCGLYCGICAGREKGECHGCGCACGKCAGAAHVQHCAIARCVAARKLESCAACPDLPCTQLIQFAHDPIWRTHAPVLDNLRRRKAIGTAAWLREQEAYWKDPRARARWLALYAECDARHSQAPKPSR